MKLIVKEHVNAVVQPIVRKFQIVTEATDSVNRIPLTIGLQKGDILVYREYGKVERLPVGTDGQILMADSSEPLGVKWVTPS